MKANHDSPLRMHWLIQTRRACARILGTLGAASLLLAGPAMPAAPRAIPQPLTGNPGNVFVAGQRVLIPLPAASSGWSAVDYDDAPLAKISLTNGSADLGVLPVGWYRLRLPRDTNAWISFAVLQPLPEPTPDTSPISIDVAMSWFYPTQRMAAAANLCALAGINWVRDRLNWAEMEPAPGTFATANRYDAAAWIQAAAGLRVLQVNHISPRWANENPKRLPMDLRDAFRFHREMSARWKGQVLAFEPWNEADIVEFGGHTGAEMASLQKAAYLGLKAGNPHVIAGLNVWAKHRRAQLDDFADNQASAYFDTFNLHHYDAIERYPALYADFRAVSAGKPMWVSEFAMPVRWSGDEKLKEPADAELRVQSERLVKAFAASLFEGVANSFYFLLPHYSEGQTQFGILRPDLTPRPAYVALAAVGRLLSSARPLGKLTGASELDGYLFRSSVDGAERDVAVAWGATHTLPQTQRLALHDHLGRDVTGGTTGRPVFAIYERGAEKHFRLSPPPEPPSQGKSSAANVVFQTLWPADKTVLSKSAYQISSERAERIPAFAYNFGSQRVTGRLTISHPSSWKVGLPRDVAIEPHGRVEIPIEIDCRGARSRLVEQVKVVGDFGPAGEAVLSVRLMPEPNQLFAARAWPVAEANRVEQWEATVSGAGPVRLTETTNGVVCEASPGGADKWVYPRVQISAASRVPGEAQGVSFTFTLLEGEGTFRALFDERNGSGYVIDWMRQPQRGKSIEAIALFEDAVFGHGWSKPDPNHRFDPTEAVTLKIGCNTKSQEVKFVIRNVRWVAF